MQILTHKNQKELKDHGNFAFPVDISIEKIQSYETGSFLWHWHPEVELTLFLSGEMEYLINDSIYYVKAGDGLFGNSNALHSGIMRNGSQCTYLSITFHPRFLYGYENSILQTKYVSFITSNESWASFLLTESEEWQRDILENMKTIYALSQERPVDFELQVHMLLMDIWQKLYRHFAVQPEKEHKPGHHLQRLRDIISYIQDNYSEKITLEDVARSANICQSECCRFFKKHMNMTIFDYILYLRIQNSLPLLKTMDSVTEVSTAVGFTSSSYYSQIFKRQMGCSPLEYKKQQK